MSASFATRCVVPESSFREDPAPFARWALATLQIPVETDERDAMVLLPEGDREAFGGQQRLRLPMSGPAAAGQESLTADGRFMHWLTNRLRHAGPAVHARPSQQPMGVNEIASTLFGAYSVEGGQVHLAGCQMTDYPFLRLSFAGDEDDQSIRHIYVAPDGSAVDEQTVESLALTDVKWIAKAPPRINDSVLRSLASAGRRIAAKQTTSRDPEAATIEPVAATVIWVRHAEGWLQFTIGKQSERLPFSGWARLVKAKPFVARHSGASTFRLAATDDGRIDSADEVALCEHSSRRVLRQELVECSVTGRRVLPDFTERCPASGRPALRTEFAVCEVCRQRVSNAVLSDGTCSACRGLSKITKDDPRLAWILGEYPGLDRWRSWQLAETHTSYVAQASGLMRRLLIVFDKETLAIRRLAVAGRLSTSWIDSSDAEREELLR